MSVILQMEAVNIPCGVWEGGVKGELRSVCHGGVGVDDE